MNTNWMYVGELEADDYRCDLCGQVADSVHVVAADGRYPRRGDVVRAVLACPDHDAGGYWFSLSRLESMLDHLEQTKDPAWRDGIVDGIADVRRTKAAETQREREADVA